MDQDDSGGIDPGASDKVLPVDDLKQVHTKHHHE